MMSLLINNGQLQNFTQNFNDNCVCRDKRAANKNIVNYHSHSILHNNLRKKLYNH